MGLVNSEKNLITMLYKYKYIKKNIFSLCLSQYGGYFTVEEINNTYHKGEIKYVSIPSNGYYYINIKNISIYNEVNIDTKDYSFFVDSGTTITYFPKDLSKKITDYIENICKIKENIKYCGKIKKIASLGLCYQFENYFKMNYTLEKIWPNITFNIENKINYIWTPKNYVFNDSDNKNIILCMGFVEEGRKSKVTLGSSWMHGYDFIFDRENKKLGLVEADCNRGLNEIEQKNWFEVDKSDIENNNNNKSNLDINKKNKSGKFFKYFVFFIIFLITVFLIIYFFRKKKGKNYCYMIYNIIFKNKNRFRVFHSEISGDDNNINNVNNNNNKIDISDNKMDESSQKENEDNVEKEEKEKTKDNDIVDKNEEENKSDENKEVEIV